MAPLTITCVFIMEKGIMQHWLDHYPALRIMHKRIAAAEYNCIRVSLLRESLPWRITLRQFRCLHCIIDDLAWVCIDESHNDLPILAWTNFNTAQRSRLDAPVDCELRLFHMHAGLIMGTALDALYETIASHNKKNLHNNTQGGE